MRTTWNKNTVSTCEENITLENRLRERERTGNIFQSRCGHCQDFDYCKLASDYLLYRRAVERCGWQEKKENKK